MARPPLALGHHGSIKTCRVDGRWVSRCRFRDRRGPVDQLGPHGLHIVRDERRSLADRGDR